ncbi:MAG: glycoside hydrolase family 127 protein [Acidobacteriota bacterium]
MIINRKSLLFSGILLVLGGCGLTPSTSNSRIVLERDYPVQPVPFTDVHLDDVFWAPRIETNRSVTIPYAFQKCEETGRIENFVRAAQAMRNDPALTDREVRGFPFDDTDVYKVIEGASFGLSVKPDPAMDQYLDGVIAKIAAAQEPDGYLYTARTINPEHPHEWAGPERWVNVSKLSHELYNMGHLYEAAVAHYQATGKRTLLDVALKNADLLCTVFGAGKDEDYPGHQIVEMGLVKLYRVTGRQKYLDLAKFFLDTRGPGGDPYNQADKKVVDQSEAVGHAVRATYMYSGMADVAALTGNQAYIDALNRIWGDVVGRKLYVTGGIGALHKGEAFGEDYHLPNMSAYCETCAAVGNVYWNERLFLLEPDSKYIDTLEQTLYNGLISGVSLDGKSFFYPNPLESKGDYVRSPWFGCACCPGNITRFVASVPGYQYGVQDPSIYVNLYASGTANLKVGAKAVRILQQTRYPWEGKIQLTVEPEAAGPFTLRLRIPGWARNEANPDGLYHFLDTVDESPQISVNGQALDAPMEKGYAVIDRTWEPGDTVDLNLPMPIRRVIADERVEADRGRVALQRGPVVYCLEGTDNTDGKVRNLYIEDGAQFQTAFQADLLGGVETLSGQAVFVPEKGRNQNRDFVAIPYYAWANRGPSEMTVWVARDAEHAKVQDDDEVSGTP